MTGILNHLWQSTAFAAVVAFVAWLLRRHSPRVRYWLWLAASLKFLIPFSWLVSTGARVQLPAGAPALATIPVETISTYLAPVSMPVPAIPLQASFNWALWLGLLWLGGAVVLLIRRCRQWSRLRRLARSAKPISYTSGIPVLESSAGIDPGVFGLLHPVLLLPAGFADALEPAQFEGVLLHELRHVRYRDNLTAALHMGVEIAFWFYPPVWWIGAKLIEERERDCDQAALAQGGSPGEYARGILQVCRRYVESPLPCAAGISGADLKKRIREIMVWRGSLPLTLRAKMAVMVAAVIAVLVPFGIGIARGQSLRPVSANAQSASPAQLPAFDAVSVRPFQWIRGRPWDSSAQYDPQRFHIEGVTPEGLIDIAYSLNEYQLAGLPDWAKNFPDSLYSITATTAQPTSKDQMLLMLRRVLAERFQLVLSESDKVQPVYDLVVAKGGPKLQPIPEDECTKYNAETQEQLHLPPNALYTYAGCTISDLVTRLNFPDHSMMQLYLPIVDKTGLTGTYRIVLWQATGGLGTNRAGGRRWGNIELVRDALKRELGLELVKSKGPYRVYAVKHIVRPTAN